MQKKKIVKRIKLIITLVIVFCFVWFLVISPMITFHKNEKVLENAARRYFELNSGELPTGERVKTLTLNTLYHKSFLEKDIYIPYTNKTCSIDNSWVKVRRENNEYKYYVYLECGILSSSVDHTGPEIKLNGDMEIQVGVSEEFSDPGVKSVIDSNDGKLKIEDVTIKGEVDTSKVGTYEIQYIAFDNLRNKTTVTRTVSVVQKLYSTVKKALGDTTNYVGNPENNYIRLSNMLFRIYGIDGDNNIIIVADEDVANVNYTKIDKWLEYYYEHLNEITQKMIVESKYCNAQLSDTVLDTLQCSSYTDKKKVYIPSVIEVNKAEGEENFMKPSTMSWVSNQKDDKQAYLTRNVFFGEEYGKSFLAYDVEENYGIRPMFTIKGSSLITGGDGTSTNPYIFGDNKKAKGGSLVNTRSTGEYVLVGGDIYRIVDVMDDGTTKVVGNSTIGTYTDYITCTANIDSDTITYDPKDKTSSAYYINNKISEYVDTSYFVNHTIKVPIYKNKIIYGEETSTKEYKVVLSAPNMYEMFSAQPQGQGCRSYWMINTSKKERVGAAVYDIGVPINEEIESNLSLNVRVVGFLKDTVAISSGKGTLEDPYIIK